MAAVVVLHLGLPKLYHAGTEPGRPAAFIVLGAFIVSFLFIRTSARLMRSPRVPWWPGSVTTDSGLHIHHLVWGISLLLLSGFTAFVSDLEDPWWQITAVGFGIGAGLTLDEFALWLRLSDVYWSEQGRASIDAVIVAVSFAAFVVVGVRPFGLDDPGSIIGTATALIIGLGLAVATFFKGRILPGVLAIFLWPVGAACAARLARPDSPWARRFYRGRRASKLARAQERFRPDRRVARLGQRVVDLIGGRPSS